MGWDSRLLWWQGLKNGIDLILYEREKQQANFVIFSFYTNAVHKGTSTTSL